MTRPIAPAAATPALTPATAQPGALPKAAKAFEAVFLRQMIGTMRQATLADGMFDSSASDQFRDMADSHLADDMANKGLGIAGLLVKQLAPNVHGAAATAAPGGAVQDKTR